MALLFSKVTVTAGNDAASFLVDGIPREFYRHKVISSALLHYLRQRRGIAEYVGEPYHFASLAKLVFKKLFAV